MILMLTKEDRQLDLFASPVEIEGHVEAIDIENDEYVFCDERGQVFAGKIAAPGTNFSSGRVRLVPTGEIDPSLPLQLVSRAHHLGKSLGRISNLDALRAVLAKNP